MEAWRKMNVGGAGVGCVVLGYPFYVTTSGYRHRKFKVLLLLRGRKPS